MSDQERAAVGVDNRVVAIREVTMWPEDLADTIYVVPAKMEQGSIEMTIRIDRHCMLIGLPAVEEEAQKWEKMLRTYVRYLIHRAIEMDRESKGDTDER